MEKLSNKRTSLILFIEGFVSVSLQMIMIRQLTPFVGSSVVITSLIIGVFLASLSLGYTLGGRTKEDYLSKLLRNIIFSAVFISFSVSYVFMNAFFELSGHFINSTIYEVLLYLVIFLAPVVFMLGQTIPLLTNFYKSNKTSAITGDSMAINTVGSVLGSVITSILLFSYLGVANTVLVDVILLGVVMTLILQRKNGLTKGWKSITIISYLAIIAFAYVSNVSKEKDFFQLTNEYTNYSISESEKGLYFIMNKSYASAILKNGDNWNYMNKIKKILFSEENLNLKNANILILGSGGFTLSHGENIPDNNYTYIDIDPEIKDMAERYFLMESINGEFFADDARVFINKTKIKYDAIVVDLYSNKTSIPWHLMTTEFVSDIKNITKDEGVVIFNIISSGFFSDDYSKAIYNTISNKFDYCFVSPSDYKSESTNILYVCKKTEDEKRTIYIDNLSKYSIDEISKK